MSDLKLLHSLALIYIIYRLLMCVEKAGRQRESKNCRNDRHLLPAANLNNRRERERGPNIIIKSLTSPLLDGWFCFQLIKQKFNFRVCVLMNIVQLYFIINSLSLYLSSHSRPLTSNSTLIVVSIFFSCV